MGLVSVQKRTHDPCDAQRANQSNGDADRSEHQALTHDQTADVRCLGAKRDANADLARPLCHDVRNHAVDPDRTEQQRHTPRNRQHDHGKRRLRHRRASNFIERL